VVAAEIRPGHTSMMGIKVSPVHGWHCICGRCKPAQPPSDVQHRDAA
jgi:hypothetical protein